MSPGADGQRTPERRDEPPAAEAGEEDGEEGEGDREDDRASSVRTEAVPRDRDEAQEGHSGEGRPAEPRQRKYRAAERRDEQHRLEQVREAVEARVLGRAEGGERDRASVDAEGHR